MSHEAHLAENAIKAYKKNDKDYWKGFEDFNIKLNRKQAEEVFGNADHMENIYEIIIEAYNFYWD